MTRRAALLQLYQDRTGTTTHRERPVPGDGIKDTYARQGYWPDRSNHFSGW